MDDLIIFALIVTWLVLMIYVVPNWMSSLKPLRLAKGRLAKNRVATVRVPSTVSAQRTRASSGHIMAPRPITQTFAAPINPELASHEQSFRL